MDGVLITRFALTPAPFRATLIRTSFGSTGSTFDKRGPMANVRALIFFIIAILSVSACHRSFSHAAFPDPTSAAHAEETTASLKGRPQLEFRKFLANLAFDHDASVIMPIRQTLALIAALDANGSGVVVADRGDSRSLLVTCRHVLPFSEDPMVSFDGWASAFQGRIDYVDRDYDLAVVELPFRRPHLDLMTEYKERQDVFVVGYPFNSMEMVFQTTLGTISNPCIEERQFFIGSQRDRCYVLHTAANDPGTSGGPLLNRNNQIIGIVMGNISNREHAGVAVPAEAVRTALEHAERAREHRLDRAWMTAQLEATCYRFVNEFSTTLQSELLEETVTSSVVVHHGKEVISALSELFSKYEGEQLDEAIRTFRSNPYASIQLAIVKVIHNTFTSMGGVTDTERCERIVPGDDVLDQKRGVRINVSFRNGKQMTTRWKFDHGNFLLDDL